MPNQSPTDRQATLQGLVEAALGGDVLTETDGGFIAVMSKGNPQIRRDIPAAFEMYGLLSHCLTTLPTGVAALATSEVRLAPGVLTDESVSRVVAMVPVDAGQLQWVAHWVADSLPSDTVRNMPGLLALPFEVQEHDGVRHLIPEWFAAYYVGSAKEHCVPVLTLRSVTLDARFADWVSIALERMGTFGLPCEHARRASTHRASQ